ncbi:MAG: enoyl-CoA hydratase/isomerase family protein [Acidimicrobiia bacterium]|nr:enoyl-CoA hydratase/isomerase family protein [Acidimicrobiia bacterium]
MTTSDVLTITEDGPVRVVRLNRPDALNAIDEALHTALTHVWGELEADRDARAVVITGEGRAFTAGGDMGLLQRMSDDLEVREFTLAESARIMHDMIAFRLPLVAAVNGPAVGLGCSLAMLSDIVHMEQSAYLADPHVPVGLVAGDGGAISWPLAMSLLSAKEYIFTGDEIPAAEAHRLGLANKVVPDGESFASALAFAQRLAALPPQAVQDTKKALNVHLARAATGLVELCASAEHRSFDTPELKANVARFVERQAAKD